MILRLKFDNNNWEDDHYFPSSPGVASVLFTKVVACCRGGSAGRGGEDPEIAAAVEAGLSPLMPNGGGGIDISGSGEGARRRHRGRGEGGGVDGRGEGAAEGAPWSPTGGAEPVAETPLSRRRCGLHETCWHRSRQCLGSVGCSTCTCTNGGGARSERGNPDADHQQQRGGDRAGTFPAGGECDMIGQASRTMAHRCPPRRSSRGSTIVRILNGVNARSGGMGEEDMVEAIPNRKS